MKKKKNIMKKNKGVRIMLIVIGSILSLICLLIIWFRIPYSSLKSKFMNDYNLISKETLQINEIMSEDDIKTLPMIVQKYMKYCGYLGSPKQSYIKSFYKNVRFVQGVNGKELIIDYTKYNFALEPQSIALIESSMFGIPFQGYDSFISGKGRMLGVFAKAIPVFDQLGSEMDKAGLVTFLSECLLIPSSALMDYIEWEEIGDYQVKATISYYGIVASGIFSFSKEGEILQFTTNDRAITEGNGKMVYIPWTVECSNYKENEMGYKIPTSLKAIWNYEEGDFIYFDSDNLDITYY